MTKRWDDKQEYISSLLEWGTRIYKNAETDEEIKIAEGVLIAIIEGEIQNGNQKPND